MRKTIRKWFWVWDFDKEERWLNEMAARGLALVSTGWCRYDFEDCTPGEYSIRLELLKEKPSHPESVKYMEFLEETGAEHVGSYMSWVYLRKKTADGEFQLFSDNASRVKYLTHMLSFIALVVGLNLLIGIENLVLAFVVGLAGNYIGFLNLAIGLFGLPGIVKLWKKRNRIKKESQLFE